MKFTHCLGLTALVFCTNIYGEVYVKTTRDIHRHRVIEHFEKPFSLDELTADSIQYIYNASYRDKCSVAIFKPQFATVLSFFTKEQYSDGMGLNGFGTNGISNSELNALYKAISSGDNEKGFEIFNEIFNRVNKNNCKIRYYGKDKLGRKTCYIYKLGFENRGIVVFYPDDFSCLIKGKSDLMHMWAKDPTRAGYNEFFRRFMALMMDHNKHIAVYVTREYNEDVFILRFKEFKGCE